MKRKPTSVAQLDEFRIPAPPPYISNMLMNKRTLVDVELKMNS